MADRTVLVVDRDLLLVVLNLLPALVGIVGLLRSPRLERIDGAFAILVLKGDMAVRRALFGVALLQEAHGHSREIEHDGVGNIGENEPLSGIAVRTVIRVAAEGMKAQILELVSLRNRRIYKRTVRIIKRNRSRAGERGVADDDLVCQAPRRARRCRRGGRQRCR